MPSHNKSSPMAGDAVGHSVVGIIVRAADRINGVVAQSRLVAHLAVQ